VAGRMGDGVLRPAKVLRVEFYTAVRVLRNDGISDVTVLPGYYTSVSLKQTVSCHTTSRESKTLNE
jgi:hypothetical protein